MLRPLILPSQSFTYRYQSSNPGEIQTAPGSRIHIWHPLAFVSKSASSDRDIELLNLVSQKVKARRRHHCQRSPAVPCFNSTGWTQQKISATMVYTPHSTSSGSSSSGISTDEMTPRQTPLPSFRSHRSPSTPSSPSSSSSISSKATSISTSNSFSSAIFSVASSSTSNLLLNVPSQTTRPASVRSRNSSHSLGNPECLRVAPRQSRSPKGSRKAILKSLDTSPLMATSSVPHTSPKKMQSNPLMAAIVPDLTAQQHAIPSQESTVKTSNADVSAFYASPQKEPQPESIDMPSRSSSRPMNAGHRKRRSKVLADALKRAKDAREASLLSASVTKPLPGARVEARTLGSETSVESILPRDIEERDCYEKDKDHERAKESFRNEARDDSEDDQGWEDFISGGYLSFPLPPTDAHSRPYEFSNGSNVKSLTSSAFSTSSLHSTEGTYMLRTSSKHSQSASAEERSMRRQSARRSRQWTPPKTSLSQQDAEFAWASSDEEVDGLIDEEENRLGLTRGSQGPDCFSTPSASPMVPHDSPQAPMSRTRRMDMSPFSLPTFERSQESFDPSQTLATEEHLARAFGIRVKRMSTLSPQRQTYLRPLPAPISFEPSLKFLNAPLPNIPTSQDNASSGGGQDYVEASTMSRERSDSSFSTTTSSARSSTASSLFTSSSSRYGETSSIRTSLTRPSSAESQSSTSKPLQAAPARPQKSPTRPIANLPAMSAQTTAPILVVDTEEIQEVPQDLNTAVRGTSGFSLGKLLSRSPSNSSVRSFRDKYRAFASSSNASLATINACPNSPTLSVEDRDKDKGAMKRASSNRLGQKIRSKLAFIPITPNTSSTQCPPTPDDVPITPHSEDSLYAKTSFASQQQVPFSSRIQSFHPYDDKEDDDVIGDDEHCDLPAFGKKDAMLFHLIPSPPATAATSNSFS